MNRTITFSCLAFLAAGLALAQATPPQILNYQGILRDADDVPLDGAHDMVFRFYNAESSGTLLLMDSHEGAEAVTVTGGLFDVHLGGGTITPGTYGTLGDVFANTGNVWLEIQVGAETLGPRVRVVAAGYALNAASLEGRSATELMEWVPCDSDPPSGFCVERTYCVDDTNDTLHWCDEDSSTWTDVSGSGGTAPHVFDCRDYDGDGDTDAQDIVDCINAAIAFVTTTNDDSTDLTYVDDPGSDNAVIVDLPPGEFKICDTSLVGGNPCPFTLPAGGMHFRGVRPRIQVTGSPPGKDLILSGGTELDADHPNCQFVGQPCSVNGVFTGNNLRGITFEGIGIKHFHTAFKFGAPNVEGISFSRFQDVMLYGNDPVNTECDSHVQPWTDTACSKTAFDITNFQFVRMDGVYMSDCYECVRFANDDTPDQGGNSVITDLFIAALPNPTYGILLECVQGQLNLMQFQRPQVNAFESDNLVGSSLIKAQGQTGCPINQTSFLDTNLEGSVEYAMKLEGCKNCGVTFAGGNSGATTHFYIDDDTDEGVFISHSGAVDFNAESPTANKSNLFYGFFRGTATIGAEMSTVMGHVRDLDAAMFVLRTNRIVVQDTWGTNLVGAGPHAAIDVQSAFGSNDSSDTPFFGSRNRAINLLTNPDAHSSVYGSSGRAQIQWNGGANNTVDEAYGLFGELFLPNSTHTGTTINTMFLLGGQWSELGASGWTSDFAGGLHIPDIDTVGGAISGTGLFGGYIGDMKAQGSPTYSFFIKDQTGGTSADGNIRIPGEWNNGHFVIDETHMWNDGGIPRYDRPGGGAPTAEDDGYAVIVSQASGADGGIVLMAGSGTSCDTLCCDYGMESCNGAFEFTAANFAAAKAATCSQTTGSRFCVCRGDGSDCP